MANTGKEVTINMALGKLKSLHQRHSELCTLRNINARRVERFGYGKDGEKEVSEPTYSAIELDKKISRIAKEIRLLDESIKATNQVTAVKDYLWDDEVLSEIL